MAVEEKNTKRKTISKRNVDSKKQRKISDKWIKVLHTKVPIWLLVIIIVVVGILWGLMALLGRASEPAKRNVVTKSMLEKIVHVSDLSTYEAVYNGVAKVMNVDKPEKVDYYVSYESTVKAGIDFSKVKIQVDNRTKNIAVTLPEISIGEVDVDITSMDFIFQNARANTPTVTQEAYRLCIEDATTESQDEGAIYDLAEQNAKNIIEALIRPFVQQMDEGYTLSVSVGDD